jgi:hypothetical protein
MIAEKYVHGQTILYSSERERERLSILAKAVLGHYIDDIKTGKTRLRLNLYF